MAGLAKYRTTKAKGRCGEIYDAVKAQRGKTAHFLSVHSLYPDVLQHNLDLYMHLMLGPGPLSLPAIYCRHGRCRDGHG